jgi:hypothetical protein
LFAQTIRNEELHLLGTQVGPARDAYPKTPNTSQTHLLELPAREPHQRVLSDLPFVLRIVLYLGQGCGQGVFLYDLRRQVFGHVGDGGVGVIRQLRADHYWGAAIFVVDPDTTPASV